MIANVILAKPTDYRVCKHCRSINWYENEECHGCGGTEFSDDEKDLIEEVKDCVDIDYENNEDFYEQHISCDPADYTDIPV